MRRRIPQLDAVRGLAILLVMLHNISLKYPLLHSEKLFANGWMGVDLFFVLSGLLITGILLDTKDSDSYFKNFYVRRCLRIWPLYYSLLFFMFVLIRFISASQAHAVLQQSSPWWAYSLFLQNFLVPQSINAAGPLAVTWSLAIEEQFYLVWPFIVRLLSPGQLRWLAIAEICASPALRFYLAQRHVYLYTNVFCRLDGLMAGALLALLIRSPSFVPEKYLKRAWTVFALALPLAFVTQAAEVNWIVYTFTALASAAFVFLSLFSAQKWLIAILTNRFLLFSGTISYGLYLLHKIPFGMVQALHLDRKPYLPPPIILVLSYAVAVVSWNVLEKPVLRLKRFFEAAPPPLDHSRPAVPAPAEGKV